MHDEHLQLDDQLHVRLHRGQIPTHAGLVGDNEDVFGVGLARATIGAGGPAHRHSRHIDDLLAGPFPIL